MKHVKSTHLKSLCILLFIISCLYGRWILRKLITPAEQLEIYMTRVVGYKLAAGNLKSMLRYT